MNVGLVAVPFLLAKLWSVIPRLFVWPPVASPAQAIERLSIALLVASAVFQFVTGIMNAQYWYAFHFNFVVAHYYGAVVFVASLVLHVLVKTPVILRAYRERGWLRPLRDDLLHTRPEPSDGDGGLVVGRPRPADDQPPRPVRLRRRRVGAAAGRQRRRDDRRAAAVAGLPGAAARGLPGQQDRRASARDRGDGRGDVPPAAVERRPGGRPQPRSAAGAAAAHGTAADRVRRGLDHDAGVDRRPAGRPRAAGRRRRRTTSTARSCARSSPPACSRRRR